MKLGLALPGPHRGEAERIQRYCVDQGMSWKRAYAVACMASIGPITWMFQASVAKYLNISVRTVQRAVRQAKSLGVLVSRRLRRNEQPQGARSPISCGGALRRFVGWGVTQARALARYARYRMRWLWYLQNIAEKIARQRADEHAEREKIRSEIHADWGA